MDFEFFYLKICTKTTQKVAKTGQNRPKTSTKSTQNGPRTHLQKQLHNRRLCS
jgi:hypothetical protein